jgi:iron complex transport system ATP-binding protein
VVTVNLLPVNRRTILNVSRLRVERGDTVILDGLSWRVRQGEHWAILGANGSGKTSLLSALTAYLPPTDGVIEVLGKRYGESDWRELRKRIGLVSSSIRQLMADDEPALETVISGKYAMIDYWGVILPADRLQAIEILKKIECAHLAKRPWGVLSQGERQRLLIGRALMAEPSLLVLDEPCAGLDPAAREHFLQFIQGLGRRRHAPTLVLVTHHVEEIVPVISHVLVLKAGKVLASGEKETVLTSATLTRAFDTPIQLHATKGRYSLTVAPSTGVTV